jgi:hypothetical protein
MSTEQSYAVVGLAEHELRSQLEEELVRAMRAEGEVPTVHALAHSVARILELDHQRMAAQLERGAYRWSRRSRFERRMRELLIRVESGSECPKMAKFLRGYPAQRRVVDEHSLAIDLDDDPRSHWSRLSATDVAGTR